MRPSGKRSLHHCSFRSEKNQRTEDKLITLMKKVCCQLSPFLCVTQERRDPCTNLVRKGRAAEKNQVAKWKTKQSAFSLKGQKEQILVDFRAEIQKHDFQADSERRRIQELELSSLSEEKLITLLHVMNNFDEINYFFMNNYRNKIWTFWKLISKVFMRWKN